MYSLCRNKRRKLEECFEELSIDDIFDLNQENIKYNKQRKFDKQYIKQEYYRKELGCGKRRRCRMFFRNTLEDFSEIKREIEIAEYSLLKLNKKMDLIDSESIRIEKNQRKREEKQNFKNLPVAAKSRIGYDKRIIELIYMCNKGFPKSYQKLMDDYIKYVTNGDICTNENDDVCKQNNLSYEEEKSCQFITDEFIMHINSRTLIVNTRLVNEVMLIMNKNFENDYEMSDAKISNFSQPPKSHLLAIEDIAYDSENSEYVNPITHCTIEEMN